MARIPEEEIERLKREVPIQRLAEGRGVVLKPHGKDLIGLCPFHDDHEPSLVITPEKNLWHCLGACRAGGSVIDWVMRAEGVSFRHAVELLREGVFPLAASMRPVGKSSVKRQYRKTHLFSLLLAATATIVLLMPPTAFGFVCRNGYGV